MSSTQQSVTACCGPDVVSWDPTGSDTDDVARLFEIHHACNVNSFAWLRGGKAIAVGADDCVVSLYALPGKKVVTTAPKLQHLPSGASPVTTVANMGEHLVFGTYNGNVDVVLLPDIQLKQLHKEAGQAITSIALTPQRRVMMCSANGQVVRTQFDPVSQQRPHYLQCKDTHARTSLAASTVDEQVAAGCLYGGIHVWDAASGLAKHHIQDGDSSLQIAFQVQSPHTLLAGSAARTLKVWDLRSAQLVAQTETPKKVTSLARGLAAHDVAIGDATGVVWLHDLRRLDTSVQRLSCGKRHAVTCIV